jgi:hypothetical protein
VNTDRIIGYAVVAVLFGLANVNSAVAELRGVERGTAVGLVLYFAVAVITHLRAGDVKNNPLPAALLAFGALTLALAIASA